MRRRWRLAAVVGLTLAVGAGISAWYLVPMSKYTARATLHVSTQPKYIMFDPKERLSDYRTYQRTQVALAKSRFVQLDALRRPGVAALETVREHGDADEWLARTVKIDFPDASEVLQISLDGDRPAELATLVNAILDSYMDLIVKQEQTDRGARLETLKNLWRKYKENLQAKRTALRELSESIGSHDAQTLTMAQQSKFQQLDLCEQELLQVRSTMRRANSDLAVLQAHIEASEAVVVPDAAVEMDINSSPDIQELTARAGQLREKYAKLKEKLRDLSDPSIASIALQLRAATDRLALRRAELRPAAESRLREGRVAEDRAALIKLEAQISASRLYQAALEEEIAQLRGKSQTINRGSLDLSQHQDDLRLLNDTTQRIGAEVEAMEVELGAPPRIRVVDRAGVPTKRDEFRRLKAGAAAGLVAAVLSLLGVSYWEFRARRIGTVDEVVHGLGMKLVGALPFLPQRPRLRDKAAVRMLQSNLVESIDAARTMILHASRSGAIRVLMVASAQKGEGKTSLSCHLSASLARAGRRTLFVDCDLRSPAAHHRLDCLPAPGLSEILRGELGPDEAIQLTSTPGLHFVAAGRSDELAVQALAQDPARLLFDELRRRYDFVVVDTSPVLPVADTLLVAGLADAVIFSILRDVSRVPLVHSAYERLSDLGVRILGAVVVGTKGGAYGCKYNYPNPADGGLTVPP